MKPDQSNAEWYRAALRLIRRKVRAEEFVDRIARAALLRSKSTDGWALNTIEAEVAAAAREEDE